MAQRLYSEDRGRWKDGTEFKELAEFKSHSISMVATTSSKVAETGAEDLAML